MPVPYADNQFVTLGTTVLFLIGNRAAIQRVSDTPAATWLALSWVILAALFRDYDHADLLRFPGWLAVPLLASTLLAGFFFVLLKLNPDVRACPLPNRIQFRRLLTCFWMTAPMAMIYAIPVERFLSPPEATRWNLTFLALVATWRVLLISRVISVLYGLSLFQALCPVMLLADSLALTIMVLIPIPVLQVMGGIRLSESSEIINAARLNVIAMGVLTWLIWLIGFAISVSSTRKETAAIRKSVPLPILMKQGPWIVVGIGFATILIACCFTQPEQQRAAKFRQLLLTGETAQAISFLSQFTPKKLPPHWDAPPRIDYLEQNPRLFIILDAIAANDQTSAWIQEIYAEKLLSRRGRMMGHQQFWYDLNVEDVKSLVHFLKSSPEVLQKFDRGGPGGEHSWEDSGSIRCTVAELIENDFKLPGSLQPLPRELVMQLLDLDNENEQRGCGTKEDVEKRLKGLSDFDSKKDVSEAAENQ